MWPGLAENRIYKSQKNVELGCKEKDECDMQDGVQKTGSQEKGNQRGRNSKGRITSKELPSGLIVQVLKFTLGIY